MPDQRLISLTTFCWAARQRKWQCLYVFLGKPIVCRQCRRPLFAAARIMARIDSCCASSSSNANRRQAGCSRFSRVASEFPGKAGAASGWHWQSRVNGAAVAMMAAKYPAIRPARCLIQYLIHQTTQSGLRQTGGGGINGCQRLFQRRVFTNLFTLRVHHLHTEESLTRLTKYS